MISNLSISILPYDSLSLKEEDIESLVNFIVKIAECGFEDTITKENTLKKDIS